MSMERQEVIKVLQSSDHPFKLKEISPNWEKRARESINTLNSLIDSGFVEANRIRTLPIRHWAKVVKVVKVVESGKPPTHQ